MMSTGKHDTMTTTTIGTNHNNNSNEGFVPPSARRKIRTRAIQHRKQRRHNFILGTVVIAITFLFVSLGVLNNSNNVDYYQNNINHQHKKRNLNKTNYNDNENSVAGAVRIGGDNEDNAAVVNRNKNLRGGDEERNIWVSEESQPFVSLGRSRSFFATR